MRGADPSLSTPTEEKQESGGGKRGRETRAKDAAVLYDLHHCCVPAVTVAADAEESQHRSKMTPTSARRTGRSTPLSLPLSLPLSVLLCLLTVGPPSARCLDFGYHDATAMHLFLVQVTQSHPNITRLHSVGKSVQGADLWVLVIGQSPRDPVILRPNVKYVGNMHGNEVVGRELLLHLIEHLVTQYGKDQKVTGLLNTTTVHIMPTMNPDGFEVAEVNDCDGDRGRYNANHFDLNRNFPDFFRHNPARIQAETRAVMNWIQDTRFVLSANLHGGTLVANYPFDSYEGKLAGPRESDSPDDDVFVHLARTYSFRHASMRNATPCTKEDYPFPDGITNGAAWYPVTGGMQDYNYVRASCYELTVELSCCKYPSPAKLPAFWEANRDALITFLLQVQMGVKGLVRDENNNSVPNAVIVIKGREQVPFMTSQRGEYWKLLLPGSYTLLVTKTGYSTVSMPFEVSSTAVTRLDVTLMTGVAGSRGSNLVVARVIWIVTVGFLSLALNAH